MTMKPTLRDELASLLTEQRNPDSLSIDQMSIEEALRLINQEDKKVALAVEAEIPHIAHAVSLVVRSLKAGGRLIYVGAGTSGRLGVLDAAECPPTFGTLPGQVIGVIAGGDQALRLSIEGAEDDGEAAARHVDSLDVSARDTVCGIAASRRTPYVVEGVKRAKARGASTIYVTTNPRAGFDLDVDVAICPAVGPEVIMGSTRMKSGTAQKMVLNMITTTAMIGLGKVYQNMMVDLQLKNQKLIERARRILMMAGNVDYEQATRRLDEANGHVKTALVMIVANVSAVEARKRLSAGEGFVGRALGAT
jgi:N-acetylmuramic acid 6-phosphate etherase